MAYKSPIENANALLDDDYESYTQLTAAPRIFKRGKKDAQGNKVAYNYDSTEDYDEFFNALARHLFRKYPRDFHDEIDDFLFSESEYLWDDLFNSNK